jgi:hypothetical protein
MFFPRRAELLDYFDDHIGPRDSDNERIRCHDGPRPDVDRAGLRSIHHIDTCAICNKHNVDRGDAAILDCIDGVVSSRLAKRFSTAVLGATGASGIDNGTWLGTSIMDAS